MSNQAETLRATIRANGIKIVDAENEAANLTRQIRFSAHPGNPEKITNLQAKIAVWRAKNAKAIQQLTEIEQAEALAAVQAAQAAQQAAQAAQQAAQAAQQAAQAAEDALMQQIVIQRIQNGGEGLDPRFVRGQIFWAEIQRAA